MIHPDSVKGSQMKRMLDAIRGCRTLCGQHRGQPNKLMKTRKQLGKSILWFYSDVDLSLMEIPKEYCLELLSCIMFAQKELKRCTSDWAEILKLRFREMRADLEFVVAEPLVAKHLKGIGDCCKWKGSVNLDVRQGTKAVYYAMAAMHDDSGSEGRYALASLSKIDWAYNNLTADRFEDLKPGELTNDQKILFSTILGQLATVERVVRLFYDKIVQYIGKRNEEKEIIKPLANINDRSLFLFEYLHQVTNADVEAYMTKSPNYSKPMKVVVSRDGNGSSPDHYEVHSPFLKMDVDDDWAVNEFMPDHEEFLMDEDGKAMEQNLREVSVREVRLGKKVAKMDIVHEPVFKMVKG